MRSLFLVWKNYQRRAEVLEPLLETKLLFLPHLFKSRYLRPLDYFLKTLVSIYTILQQKPEYIIAQSPPLFTALPAFLLNLPYVLDAHNPVFQNVGGKINWGSLPLSETLVRNACAVIVHNHGILQLAKQMYPEVIFFNIPDPIEAITCPDINRSDKQILVISSFDPDEPVEVLIETIRHLPEYTFVITADVMKLPTHCRSAIQEFPNVQLTGFLPIQDYHRVLCGSLAALVLTNQDLIQPSGACEALSSDTQLLISKTPLTTELFGEWATLVENSPASITDAICSLQLKTLDLSQYRKRWNYLVHAEITNLQNLLNQYPSETFV